MTTIPDVLTRLRRLRIGFRLFCLTAIVGGTVLLGVAALRYRPAAAQLFASAQNDILAHADAACALLETHQKRLQDALDDLVIELSAGDPGEAVLRERLSQVQLATGAQIVGVAWLSADSLGVRSAPHVLSSDGSVTAIDQAAALTRGASLPEHAWLRAGQLAGGWQEPVWSDEEQSSVVEYLAQVRRAGTVVGVARIGVSLAGIRELRWQSRVDSGGQMVITTRRGSIVEHPDADLVRLGATIETVARDRHDPLLARIAQHARGGSDRCVPFTDPETGKQCWLVGRHLVSTGWLLDLQFVADEAYLFPKTIRHDLLLMIGGGTVAILGWLGALVGVRWRRRWWWLSVGSLVALTTATVLVWALLYRDPQVKGSGQRVAAPSARAAVMAGWREESRKLHTDAPQFVPTGVYLRSIEFIDAATVRIVGHAWQKFRAGEHDGVVQGITFPEAYTMDFKPTYTNTVGDVTTVGWSFDATIRERFDYHEFPFDRQDVWLRIWSKDFDHNVVLVPDLEAYRKAGPTELPGLDHDLFMPAWDVHESFFSFITSDYNSDFGLSAYVGMSGTPELQFNVILRRDRLNILVASGLPILIVLFLSFIVLLLVTRRSVWAESFGYNTGATIGTIGALFLVVVFEHVGLRRNLGQGPICHFEAAYFFTYLAFGAMAVDSFLVSRGTRWTPVRMFDNLLPKVLFWPLLAGGMLVVASWMAW